MAGFLLDSDASGKHAPAGRAKLAGDEEKEAVVMRILWPDLGLPGLLLSLLLASAGSAPAQTPLKSINSPEGGRIMYGAVDGAPNQASGLAYVLRTVHNNCGERPQIGRVFRFRGTETVAVFFTVVNHPARNVKVAGLALAAMKGPGQVEGALVSDDAARFGTTVNPMLKELFGAWHPGEPAAASAKNATPAVSGSAGGNSGPAPKLHTVSASDNSVSIGVPDGWTLEPGSGRGAIIVKGPHGEVFALNLTRNAVDPTSQWQRNFWRQGGRPIPGSIVYAYHGNLVKAFPELFQAWRRAAGQGPAKLEIDKIDQTPPPQGAQDEECVIAHGHLDPDGKGMQTMSDMMCATLPLSWGGYLVILHHSVFPNSLADQQKTTIGAMIASWKLNAQVLNQQMAENMRQKQASDQATLAWGRQAVANINAIGANATARMNATEAANEAQHAGYWAQQDSNARNAQGFSNYLLDQTVVQDNNMYNNGTIGHGTVWNSTADALVKADPKRFEMVDTPNYWRGIDY